MVDYHINSFLDNDSEMDAKLKLLTFYIHSYEEHFCCQIKSVLIFYETRINWCVWEKISFPLSFIEKLLPELQSLLDLIVQILAKWFVEAKLGRITFSIAKCKILTAKLMFFKFGNIFLWIRLVT